ncbi:hypothetical protein OUZ56_032839 [Daphnia magna]|uniref:Pre-C2HC domain-containing protein n=1 Tax=Daphnia magna TaxID=35525 RepID=A0ABR0B9P3_9CRUS|nr:hypothetical protein OUZ56_032839 [Daphnia magna]
MGTHASDTLAPVFMRRDDGGSFKTMKSDQISAILKELELKLGRFEIGRMSIAAGGDLLIRPNSKTQQEELMKISKVLNYSIDLHHTKDDIRQVPTGDSNEDILQTLKNEGYRVTSVYRFSYNKGAEKTPSTTVALEFEGPPPNDIFLNDLVFHPEAQRANPLRCKKCQKLDHTANHCYNAQACANIGKPHEDMANCISTPRCAN